MKRCFLLLVALFAFALPGAAQSSKHICDFGGSDNCYLGYLGKDYYLYLPSTNDSDADFIIYLGKKAQDAQNSLRYFVTLFDMLRPQPESKNYKLYTDTDNEQFKIIRVITPNGEDRLCFNTVKFDAQKHYQYEYEEPIKGKYKYITREGTTWISKGELLKCIEALDEVLKNNPNR